MKANISSQGKDKKLTQANKNSLHDLIYSSDAKRLGEFCQKLKTRDIDVINSYDAEGLTPLHIAVKNQDTELVELLLEYGADPNKRDNNGNAPIILAVEKNNPKIILLLLEEGADLKKTDVNNQAILKIANDQKADKCMEILRDYGAFFVVSKKRLSEETLYSGVADFIKEVEALIMDIADESTATVSFDSFCNTIQEQVVCLFGNDQINIASIKDKLNKIFDQILLVSINKCFNKIDALKAIRHLSGDLSKINNLKKYCDNAMLVLSKLENVVEDEIVHCRALQLTTNNKRNIVADKKVVIVEQKIMKTASVQYKNSELVNRETTKIISKNFGHDVDLINFIKITPHHLQNKSEIQNLIASSEYRMKLQYGILGCDSKNFKDSQDYITKIIKNAEQEVSMDDAIMIDKLLRVGKEEHIHVLSLSINHSELDLYHEAVELGANIYAIDYPQNPKHAFDIIYAGIAAVNKLLDDNIHPDKIFIQSDGTSYGIIKFVISQFAKRGIALSEIIISNVDFDISTLENNHRCLLIHPNTHKAKASIKHDGAMKEFFKHLNKVFKADMMSRLQLNTEIFQNYTVMQLIALFIKCNQVFLKENIKLRNPNLPNDKVDNIIGVLPDEV